MEDYYTIQTPGHHNSLFAELHTLQKQGVLCDVILAAEDGEVMAHKVVLMAASKYFRQKLSAVVSATPSRICLKGISVVELANLVKYIYTGKLLVAKETMDVTLEVSEILELTGVTQGYNDIVTYERMKTDGELGSVSGDSEDVQELVITQSTDASDNVSKPAVSPGKSVTVSSPAGGQTQGAINTAASTTVQPGEAQVGQTQDIRVTEFCEDGSTITYTLDQSTAVGTSHNSSEYAFEFNPYDQQYMDVSVGANSQVSPAAKMPGLQKMVNTDQSVTDEQARHQDLLAVAIETLSDQSNFIAGVPKPTVETNTRVAQDQGSVEAATDSASDAAGQNGKIESKIVTLNAGSVANELGGQTSVYTVALDPSSINKPLLMPRLLRKKSEKEKQAEMTAKMYRKKKAELLNRQHMIKPINQPDDTLKELMQQTTAASNEPTSSPVKTRRMPRILLRSSSPKGNQTQPDKLQHVLIHRSQDGSVTTTKVSGGGGEEQSEAELLADRKKGEFGQVVNFDSDIEEDNSNKRTSNNIEAGSADGVKTSSVANAEKGQDMTTSKTKAAGHTGTKVTTGKEVEQNLDKSVVGSEVEIKNSKSVVLDTAPSTSTNALVSGVTVTGRHIKKTLGSEEKEINRAEADKTDGGITPEKSNRCDDHDQYTARKKFYNELCEQIRSSATKRKGKVPRRLPLPADEETENPGKRGSLRTRKNSRAEKSESSGKNGRMTRARSANVDDTGHGVDNKKESTEAQKADKDSKITTGNISSEGNNSRDEERLLCNTSLPAVKLKRLSQAQLQKIAPLSSKKDPKVIKIRIETVHGKNSDNRSKENEDDLKHRETEEIDLEMTVDSVCDTDSLYDTDINTGSVKRKLDNVNVEMPIKRTKRTRSGSATVKKNEDIKPDNIIGSLESDESVMKQEKASRRIRSAGSVKDEPEIAPKPPKCYCDDCDVTFLADFDLFTHQAKVHDQPLPKTAVSYSCPVCGHVANTFKTIDTHLIKHSGINVQCVYCDKRFKTYSEMKKHLIAHSVKRHKCPHCEFVSNVMACVNVHVRLKHNQNKEVIKCMFCKYKTPLQGNLRKHMQTAHELIVVTKQSIENREKYRDFEEGALLTMGCKRFDPDTMQVPKMSQRLFLAEQKSMKEKNEAESKDEEEDAKEAYGQWSSGKRGRKPALYKLPVEEFTKEVLKRHEEFLKKPERPLKFMSHSLAVATEHPSFPQASPSVRRTKADKIYYSHKPHLRVQDLTAGETQLQYVAEGASNVPRVDNEIEVIHNESPVTIVTENLENNLQTVLSIPDQHGSGQEEQLIVVTKDGRETVMHPKDFYNALVEKGNSLETRETIGVINALLAAGQEVQIQERNTNQIEIQNE